MLLVGERNRAIIRRQQFGDSASMSEWPLFKQ